MSIRVDYLPDHPEIKLYQDTDSIKINTDTIVLGNFIEVKRKEEILDIGTNNGALLLYANLQSPKKMYGIDINESSIELANKNMALNNITNCELKVADAITYFDHEVDVIVCNPPYFKTSNNGLELDNLSRAKHEDTLPLDKLMDTIVKNLRSNGKLFMSYQASRTMEILMEMEKHKLNVKKIQFVHDVKKEDAIIVLIQAVKGGKKGVKVVKPIVISR